MAKQRGLQTIDPATAGRALQLLVTERGADLRRGLREVLVTKNATLADVGANFGMTLGLGTGKEIYRRSLEDIEDPFVGMYDMYRLKEPPYSFENLYMIAEESDVLGACVEAMQKNVDGFGYQLQFLGDDISQKDSAVAKQQFVKASNFFDRVNEMESLGTVRQMMRQDLEFLGNGALEVVRDLNGKVVMMYYLPMKYLRMSMSWGTPVSRPYTIMRNGKPTTLQVKRFYRKFAQVRMDGRRLRWFKEWGDPRKMDTTTGLYESSSSPVRWPASEVLHFKLPFAGMAYGLPRWIGAILAVMGRRLADFVNYDLFENQGIPPLAVMVSGGVLTDESVKTLKEMVQGMRGVTNWNRIMLLEALVENMGLEDRGTAKLELKELSSYRKEDQMFTKYMTETEKMARHRFRLPPLYVGAAETFTHATAMAAQTVAEEQVFVPERNLFDERINTTVMADMGIDLWSFKTNGPRMVGAADLTNAIKTFTDAGAFSVNHMIDRANEAFGLEMSHYSQPWADYPVPYVLALINQKMMQPSDIIEGMQPLAPPPVPQPTQALIPGLAAAKPATKPVGASSESGTGGAVSGQQLQKAEEKIMGSDLFTKDEKDLYRLLVTVQKAVEQGHLTDADFHVH